MQIKTLNIAFIIQTEAHHVLHIKYLLNKRTTEMMPLCFRMWLNTRECGYSRRFYPDNTHTRVLSWPDVTRGSFVRCYSVAGTLASHRN